MHYWPCPVLSVKKVGSACVLCVRYYRETRAEAYAQFCETLRNSALIAVAYNQREYRRTVTRNIICDIIRAMVQNNEAAIQFNAVA